MLFLIQFLLIAATCEIDNAIIPTTMIKEMIRKTDLHLDLIKQYNDNFKKYLFTTKSIITNKKIQNIYARSHFRWIKRRSEGFLMSFTVDQIVNIIDDTVKMERYQKKWAKYMETILKIKGFLKITGSMVNNCDKNAKTLYDRVFCRTYLILNNEITNTENLSKSKYIDHYLNPNASLNFIEDKFRMANLNTEEISSNDVDNKLESDNLNMEEMCSNTENIFKRDNLNCTETHDEETLIQNKRIFKDYLSFSDKYEILREKEFSEPEDNQKTIILISNDDLFKSFLIFSSKYEVFARNEIRILENYQNNLENFENRIGEGFYYNNGIYSDIDKAISYILNNRFISPIENNLLKYKNYSVMKTELNSSINQE